MKRPAALALFTLLAALVAAPALADPPELPTPQPSWTEADWQAFSENLLVGVAGDNDGLRASALQMIIHYGDRLNVQAAAFDVARIYRNHKDERMRHLAAVSCVHLKNKWAVSYLRMSEAFERSPKIQHTIRALLAEEDARRSEKGTVETGALEVIAEQKKR
jgi:hypothetical protein